MESAKDFLFFVLHSRDWRKPDLKHLILSAFLCFVNKSGTGQLITSNNVSSYMLLNNRGLRKALQFSSVIISQTFPTS